METPIQKNGKRKGAAWESSQIVVMVWHLGQRKEREGGGKGGRKRGRENLEYSNETF